MYFQATTHNDNVQSLTEINRMVSVINLNSKTFQQFVASHPRNYSIVVLFIDIAPHRMCKTCRQILANYQRVANSYRFSDVYSNKLFLAAIFLNEGHRFSDVIRLNATPSFIHFAADGRLPTHEGLDIPNNRISAETIAEWIAHCTEIPIYIEQQSSESLEDVSTEVSTDVSTYVSTDVSTDVYTDETSDQNFDRFDYLDNLGLYIIPLLLLYNMYCKSTAYPGAKEIIIGSLAIAFCIFMMSGCMFNKINTPPLMLQNEHYGIVFVYPSTGLQLWMESFIMMFLCEFVCRRGV